MSEKVKVRLLRAYLWIEEDGSEVSFGPGDAEIPRAMAEGLQREKVDLGLLQPVQEVNVHPKIFAQREADTSARTVKAAMKLAERFGLEGETEALKVKAEQPDLQQVLRNEQVAVFLEKLSDVVQPSDDQLTALASEVKESTEQVMLARIGAIEGIGPKTMELIRKGLAESSVEVAVETFVEDEPPGAPPPDESLDDKG